MEPSITIIADDFTGAAELANMASASGCSAVVCRAEGYREAAPLAQVVAVDLDLREAAEETARSKLNAFLEGNGPALRGNLFLKVDSVLRGHVRLMIQAIERLLDPSAVLLLSANPPMGRIIRNGVYLIEGVPLEETGFRHDPGHPRTSSRVYDLVGEHSADWILPDAVTQEDVFFQLEHCPKGSLIVGASALFEAYLALKTGHAPRFPSVEPFPQNAGHLLHLCGSLEGWTRAVAKAAQHGIPVWRLFESGKDRRKAESFTHCRLNRCVLGIGEALVPGKTGLELSNELAHSALAWINSRPEGGVILVEGGATASSLFTSANWGILMVDHWAPRGIACLRPHKAPQWRCLAKPGSYPWPWET